MGVLGVGPRQFPQTTPELFLGTTGNKSRNSIKSREVGCEGGNFKSILPWCGMLRVSPVSARYPECVFPRNILTLWDGRAGFWYFSVFSLGFLKILCSTKSLLGSGLVGDTEV